MRIFGQYSFLFITTLLFMGCEGDPGNPGRDLLPADRYPPTVEVILPLASKPLYARSVVETIMLDDVGIAGHEFLVDGIPNDTLFSEIRPNSLFSWDASGLSPGRHTFQVKAWDEAGKVGESSLLYLLRSDLVTPGFDTLRYYADSARMVATEWKLPADSSGLFAGLGARFTPDRPCGLNNIGIKIHRKATWLGTILFVDVYSEKDGLPDTLTYRKVLSRAQSNDGTEVNEWFTVLFRPALHLENEFFVVVTLADDAPRDTLAIQSDDGGWANGHGLVKTLDGDWKVFNVGRGRKPNPLIYTVVNY